MCDQTEVPYLPDDVVWVKLGPVWWPGRVCKEEEIPPEIMKDLRKTPIAIVKFFQEDSFEYVKKLSNIYHYNCLKKNEFIKKGLDILRLKNRDAPSNMKLFPEDVVTAEFLTGGNRAILQDDIFLPEEKTTYTDLFATGTSKKTPKKLKPDAKKKLSHVKHDSPRLITHPRFLQLSSGYSTDYEARERKQEPIRAECDEEDTSPPTTYRCTECDYTTKRLNVMVWHNKSHTRNYASPQVPRKATKRKSTSSVKIKERPSVPSTPVESYKSDIAELESAVKMPKSNGTLRGRPPKTAGRKKSSTTKNVTPQRVSVAGETPPNTPAAASGSPVRKPKQTGATKTDEFQKSLLEDWLEDDIEQDTGEKKSDIDDSADVSVGNDAAMKDKSCFDFDDSEDHLVIDKSNFKPGRKIPRLLNEVKNGRRSSTSSTLAPDDVVPIRNSADAMEVDDYAANVVPSIYEAGIENSAPAEPDLREIHSQTSQLTEMGVDNEIEIKTEEVNSNDTTFESTLVTKNPPKRKRLEKKDRETARKVDELLAEISKTPTKLPDIPRSHKKAHLKAYCESLANQQEAAAKETAHKAAGEAKAIAVEAEAMQKVVTEEMRVAKETVAKKVTAAENLPEEKPAAEKKVSETAESQKQALQTDTFVDTQSASTVEITEPPVLQEASHEIPHIELMNTELAVSDIPLPPSKCPVTNEPIECSATNIGAETTVVEIHTPTVPEIEDMKSSEPTAAKTILSKDDALVDGSVKTESADDTGNTTVSVDESSRPTMSSVAVPTTNGDESANDVTQPEPVSVSTTSATTVAATGVPTTVRVGTKPPLKQVNATSLLRGNQRMFKIINPADEKYKTLINKLNASSASVAQLSPSKTLAGESLKPIKTMLKTPDGKSIVCNLTAQPSKMLLANSQSPGSPTKFILLNCKKTASVVTPSNTAAASAQPPQGGSGRTIDLSNATAGGHTQPTLLQKTAAAQKATAALAKSTGKNIVLDASTFQTLLQSQPPIVCKLSASAQPQQIVLPAAKSAAAAAAPQPSSSVLSPVPDPYAAGIVCLSGSEAAAAHVGNVSSSEAVVDYLVDSSGNLVPVTDDGNVAVVDAAAPSPAKDLLAKALENTDVLQTETALAEEACGSVSDACSVAQNTELVYKRETVYENLTLNTPPIMSAFETPSRTAAVANAVAISETATEMLTMQNGGAGSINFIS